MSCRFFLVTKIPWNIRCFCGGGGGGGIRWGRGGVYDDSVGLMQQVGIQTMCGMRFHEEEGGDTFILLVRASPPADSAALSLECRLSHPGNLLQDGRMTCEERNVTADPLPSYCRCVVTRLANGKRRDIWKHWWINGCMEGRDEGRKEGRKEGGRKEGRKEGREGREGGRREGGRKEGRKEGRMDRWMDEMDGWTYGQIKE